MLTSLLILFSTLTGYFLGSRQPKTPSDALKSLHSGFKSTLGIKPHITIISPSQRAQKLNMIKDIEHEV